MAEPDDAMLREAARARGFRLVKSRRRKAGGDFGKYGLTDLKSGRECLGFGEHGLTATPDEVLAFLRGGEVASWKRSLIGVVNDDGNGGSKHSAQPKDGNAPRTRAAKPRTRREGSSRQVREEARRAQPKAPPDEVAIRPANRRDAAAIAKLLAIPAATLTERLAAALRADQPPLVAERDRPIGLVAWTIAQTLQHGPRGRITLLYIAEDQRRQGVGARLLKAAEQRLSEQGATTVELALEIGLDAPAGFLRRTGWKRIASNYGKELGG